MVVSDMTDVFNLKVTSGRNERKLDITGNIEQKDILHDSMIQIR